MGHAFNVVAQTMSKVIHRIDAPGIAGMMMLGVPDAVKQWIAQPNVWRGHVDLSAKSAGPVWKLA